MDHFAGHSDHGAFTMVNCDQVESNAVSAGGRKSVCAIFAENARLTFRSIVRSQSPREPRIISGLLPHLRLGRNRLAARSVAEAYAHANSPGFLPRAPFCHRVLHLQFPG